MQKRNTDGLIQHWVKLALPLALLLAAIQVHAGSNNRITLRYGDRHNGSRCSWSRGHRDQ